VLYSQYREFQLEETQLRLAAMGHSLDTLARDLDLLRDRSALTIQGVDLLSEQCELTLDLLMSANRGGWWTRTIKSTLTQLQNLRRERDELRWLLN